MGVDKFGGKSVSGFHIPHKQVTDFLSDIEERDCGKF